MRQVFPNPADEDRVMPGCLGHGSGVSAILPFIHDHDPGKIG